MQDTNEFVLELDILEPRTLPTAMVPGGRRGKLAAGGTAGLETMCPDGAEEMTIEEIMDVWMS